MFSVHPPQHHVACLRSRGFPTMAQATGLSSSDCRLCSGTALVSTHTSDGSSSARALV